MVLVLLKKKKKAKQCILGEVFRFSGYKFNLFSQKSESFNSLSLTLASRLTQLSPSLNSHGKTTISLSSWIGISYLSLCWIGVCLCVGPVGDWIGVCLRVGYWIGVCSRVFTFQFCFPFHLFSFGKAWMIKFGCLGKHECLRVWLWLWFLYKTLNGILQNYV